MHVSVCVCAWALTHTFPHPSPFVLSLPSAAIQCYSSFKVNIHFCFFFVVFFVLCIHMESIWFWLLIPVFLIFHNFCPRLPPLLFVDWRGEETDLQYLLEIVAIISHSSCVSPPVTPHPPPSLSIPPSLPASLPCGSAGVRAILFSVLDREICSFLQLEPSHCIPWLVFRRVDVKDKLTYIPFLWRGEYISVSNSTLFM